MQGTVTDPSNSVIDAATIVIFRTETGERRVVRTGSDGRYRVEGLYPGEYEVEVSSPGFAAAHYSLSVQASDHQTVHFPLKLGSVAESVAVTEEITGIEAGEFSLSGGVSRLQIENLPLNGRHFLELARLEPGVSVVSTANPGAFANNYQRVSIGGAQYLATRIAVDGSSVDDRINGGTGLNVSQESVQEFQISAFNFSLATGATGSGAVNIITRRGGNSVHGTSFFYYRDHKLAAYPGLRRDPRIVAPSFTRRHSGFSLSGPFKQDRVFGFINVEKNNQDGVFAVANNHPIFSKLDVVHPSPLNQNFLAARFDARFNDTHTAFVRWTLDVNDSVAPPGGGVFMPSNWFSARTRAGQAQAVLTSALAPALMSDLRISHSYVNNDLNAVGAEECPPSPGCIGTGSPDIQIFDAPGFRIGHHVTVPKTMRARTVHIVNHWTWWNARHRLRFGGEWEHLNLSTNHAFYDPPRITLWGPSDLQRSTALQPLYDALPSTLTDPSAGPPALSDILRLPLRSFLIGVGDPMQPGRYNHDDASRPDLVRFYVEDGWTPRPDLMLTSGLAYLRRTKIYNRDLERPAYLAPLVGGDLRSPSRGTVNWEARAGFAWDVRQEGRTVLRAGVGLYHDDVDFFRPYLERGPLGPAGNGRVTVDGSVAGLSFLSLPTTFTGEDLLPRLPAIRSMLATKLGNGTEPAIKGIEVVKQADRIFDPGHTTPSAIHFNAGLQQRIGPGVTLSANYVLRRFVHFGGFHGVFQLDRNRYNRPKVIDILPVTGVVSFVRDPVIPLCTPSQAAALDPDDHCSTGPINIYGSGANYLYQGLQMKLEGRVSRRLHLTAGYALGSHTGFVEFNDYDDFRTAYGAMPDDRRHRFVISAIYDLPEYQGGSWLMRSLLNTWTVAVISQNDSAPALDTMLAGLDLDGDGLSRTLLPGTVRHNTLGRELDASGLRRLVEQFNADVEARSRRMINVDGGVTVIRPRTPFNQVISPISLPDQFSTGDSFITQDLRLARKLSIGETGTLSLIAEVFNVFNIGNLSGYSNMLNQPNYGRPSVRAGQVFGSGGPRALQFAARLQF